MSEAEKQTVQQVLLSALMKFNQQFQALIAWPEFTSAERQFVTQTLDTFCDFLSRSVLDEELLSQPQGESTLRESNTKLRKIAAHVPPRIYIQAKEDAGYGTAVVANFMVQDETVDQAEAKFVRLVNGIKSLRQYGLVQGLAGSHDDKESIGFAYPGADWGFTANPEYEAFEALEHCEKWLHGKLDELIKIVSG